MKGHFKLKTSSDQLWFSKIKETLGEMHNYFLLCLRRRGGEERGKRWNVGWTKGAWEPHHHQPVVEHITCRKHEQCGLKPCFWLMYISLKFYCKSCSVTVGPDGGWGSRTFQLPSIDSDAFGLGGLLTCWQDTSIKRLSLRRRSNTTLRIFGGKSVNGGKGCIWHPPICAQR